MADPSPQLNLDDVAAASARAFVSLASVNVLDHCEVFSVTRGGFLGHRWHQGAWTPWTPIAMPYSAPAAQVGAAAHDRWVDLLVVTATGQLAHRWWDETDGWSDWNDWGGGFAGPITMSSSADNHNEVWVQRHGTLVHGWLIDDSWSDWHEF